MKKKMETKNKHARERPLTRERARNRTRSQDLKREQETRFKGCGLNDHLQRGKHFENCELKRERTSWRKKKSSLNVIKTAGSRRDGEKIYINVCAHDVAGYH